MRKILYFVFLLSFSTTFNSMLTWLIFETIDLNVNTITMFGIFNYIENIEICICLIFIGVGAFLIPIIVYFGVYIYSGP